MESVPIVRDPRASFIDVYVIASLLIWPFLPLLSPRASHNIMIVSTTAVITIATVIFDRQCLLLAHGRECHVLPP